MTAGAPSRPRRPPPATAVLLALALGLSTLACFVSACHREGRATAPTADPAREQAAAPRSRPPDRFELDLAAGEYVHLTVAQDGVDRTATLFGPAGERLLAVDSLGGSVEEVHWVARVAGTHRLEVEPPVAAGETGVELVDRRPATSGDVRRAEAEAALARAHELRRTHDRENLRRAVEVYREADRLFAAQALVERRAETLYGLGLVQDGLGDSAAARRAFETSAHLSADVGARSDALQYAGRLAAEEGDAEAAAALYEAALELCRRGLDREGEALSANNLGNVYHHLGRYDAAAQLLQRATVLWQRLGEDGERANTLANLGRLELELGDAEGARGRFEEALELARRAGSPEGEAAARSALGTALLELGRPEEAREHLEAALAQRPAESRGRAMTLTALGVAHRQLGNIGEARAAYREALAIFRGQRDAGEEARTLHNLGFLAWWAGDDLRALELIDQALARFAEVPDPMGEAQTRLVRGRILRAGGELAAAREEVLRALAEIEDQRSRPRRSATRAAFFASRQDFFDFLIDLLMEMHVQDPGAGWDAEALQIAERARARSLLDSLAAHGDDPRGGSGSALLEEERELEARIEAARARWERLRGGDETVTAGQIRVSDEELESAVEPLRRRLDEVRAAIRTESPRWAALTQPRPLSAAQIREQLDGETLLLEYRLGPVRGFLWAVSRDGLESFLLPAGRDEVETAVRQVHRLLRGSYARKREIPARQRLAELADLLLAPVVQKTSGKRLVVVADGVLQYLPFAALPSPAGGEPLVAGHEVVTLPSASALAELRRRHGDRPPAPHRLWVLADPAFGGRFQPLPRTREEARTLATLLPPGEAELALGVRASREVVLDGGLGRFRFLHFATHGVFEAGSSRGSRLILAQVDEEGFPVEEGLLRLADVYRLDLAADLVVLSACETALGEEIRGEGLVGMTQGFLHAGAERVVVSLWNAPDRVAAELMERFYRGMLEEGLAPAAALREAQDAIRRREPSSSPYYWAGFLLQGEWRGLRVPVE